VEAFLFSSTAAVYGTPQYSPIPESHPTVPINPYGWTKLTFERALADFGAAYPFRWTALRYFNAAGADLDGEIGESHEPESHLIPLAAKAALGTGNALTVFGADYDTPDGTPIRDYIHVVDLAEAHVEALARLLDGGENLILNVGTGAGHTVLEVIEAAERIGGKPSRAPSVPDARAIRPRWWPMRARYGEGSAGVRATRIWRRSFAQLGGGRPNDPIEGGLQAYAAGQLAFRLINRREHLRRGEYRSASSGGGPSLPKRRRSDMTVQNGAFATPGLSKRPGFCYGAAHNAGTTSGYSRSRRATCRFLRRTLHPWLLFHESRRPLARRSRRI
jgi:nucleoside-diphosphate-sugar epimerase